MRWIERLKQKPKAYRERVAFFVASGFTGIVVCIWLVATAVQFSGEGVSEPAQEVSQAPFSGFMKAAKDQVATARTAVEGFQDELDEMNTSTSNADAGDTEPEVSNLQNIVDARKRGEVPTPTSTSTQQVVATSSQSAVSTTSEPVPREPVKREPREVLIMTTPAASSTPQTE